MISKINTWELPRVFTWMASIQLTLHNQAWHWNFPWKTSYKGAGNLPQHPKSMKATCSHPPEVPPMIFVCTPKILHDFFGMAKQKKWWKQRWSNERQTQWMIELDRNPESVDNESGLKMDGIYGVITLWCPKTYAMTNMEVVHNEKCSPSLKRRWIIIATRISFKMNSPNLKCANPAPKKTEYQALVLDSLHINCHCCKHPHVFLCINQPAWIFSKYPCATTN